MNYIYSLNISELNWSDVRAQLKILSISEQHDLEQFKFEQDKCRALVGKLLLLYVLQQHEHYRAKLLPKIGYGVYGKPMIARMQGHFNISHAQDWVVCAYSDNSIVGIDIEHQVTINLDDYQAMMTPREYQRAITNPDFDFFQLWTLKEAVIKATGQGFFLSPTTFELPYPFQNNDYVHIESQDWFLFSQRFTPNYTLSLASSRPITGKIHCISLALDAISQ
ncbi:4'-phosphopantetheinyl transferase [Orbus hercynius]|uniref:4'-phosphopantetheinyl transferase n=1 Tax=Orbus hercynius TaxID=593135 RepID=A0A495RJM5_9GAMM|nr:4'-phosphopantetheinyl transferase superfamily protein [Orbus hercynius]RKS87531.1 4'-phosphopantetheinyl transferase [Orbus hercynius]